SITTSSIKLRPAGTTNNVAATITYSGSTVVLQPTAPLAGSTTYQVVVSGIVADSTGNTISQGEAGAITWTFTTHAAATPTFTDTSATDFAAGSVNPSLYVTGDGELMLAPAAGAEFSGTALPAAWSATNPAGATVAGGQATMDAA